MNEHVDLSVVETQLTAFASLFEQNEGLRKALVNPAVPVPRKRAAIDEIVAKAAVLPIVGRTIALLADRDRLALIPDVAVAFQQRLLDLRNVVRAEVTTAEPLSADRVRAIQASLAAATGRTVDISTKVDPSIIGGMVARVGSTVFDASVTNHLQRIRQRLDASI
ncbi:MAG: ATP synthase F1 subunit delta [Acidobacteria bacterium]|nr:ATP synthase F1 subunit delta [Acidobacteriota bacterium]